MSSDEHYTYPDRVGRASFSKPEWERAKKALEKLRRKAAARCRQLIKDGKQLVPDVQLPKVRPREEQEQLDQQKRQAAERAARGYED